MDNTEFDRLAVSVAEGTSRRRLLGGLASGALALVLGAGLADARQGGKGKKGTGNNDKGNGGNGKGNGKGNGGKGNGKGKGKDKPNTRGFNAHADGEVTAPAVEGCQFEPGQCTTGFAGVGNAGHLGKVTFTSSLTADWDAATGDPVSGYCALVTGQATLTAKSAKKGSVNLKIDGTVCEDKANGVGALTLTGKYVIAGGTAKFANAVGEGTVTGAVGADGVASFRTKGNIVY